MLTLDNITKRFPGVVALRDVSFGVRGGEVHALCGENGAGKSTLMNILAGNLQPDGGTLHWRDDAVRITSPQQARALGIGIVHQERSLVETLSVAENIFPDPPRGRWGLVDFGALYAKTRALLDRLGLPQLQPKTLVGRLSAGQQQMVEIAKALASAPQLLILDEPTAALTGRETTTLFSIIHDLRRAGVGIIYISHRMAEISQLADRITVLKDGQRQGTFDASELSPEQLIRKMVGRDLHTATYQTHATTDVALRVEHLRGRGFQNVSFQLHRGEILGLAGLVGAGRTELAQALFGQVPATDGTIWKDDATFRPQHPAEGVRRGLAYVPEERKTQGIFAQMSVEDNVVVAEQQGVWFNAQRSRATAERYVQQLGIKTPSVRQKMGALSGGNQQKAVLARWLNLRPDVLLVDEPTQGVDVGAKAEIYQLLRRLAAGGTAILLISSELPELLLLADRVLVMHEGRLTATLPRAEATEETVLHYATHLPT